VEVWTASVIKAMMEVVCTLEMLARRGKVSQAWKEKRNGNGPF
jgi:hypothetical protein